MEKDSVPMKEPTAFVLINKCHHLVDEINEKTSMLQSEISKESSKKVETEPPMSLLEKELNQLINHLREVNESYRV